MMAAVGQRVRLGARHASGNVSEEGRRRGGGDGDDDGDDDGHHQPYANRRSTPVHFPYLRSRDRTLT